MLEIKQIEKYIWGIRESYHYEDVLSYLIIGEEKALLFDTGMGIYNIKEAVYKITNLPIIVLNSHSHFDHIGGNSLFDEIWIYNNEKIKNIAKNGVDKSIILENYVTEKFIKKPESFDLKNFEIKGFNYKKVLYDNYEINLKPFKFKVIHTPGHSIDHICIYEENKKFLFAGDLIYKGPIFIDNYTQFINSIKKINKLNPKKIFPGHNDFCISEISLKLKKVNNNYYFL
ncbi:MAG: MBL fold metallo-hydrolase [Candidatus Gracilibacteria bacterium]|nr:MBL fold metallo-hydrolase [Candidatus Gracilibacteria bacterium]